MAEVQKVVAYKYDAKWSLSDNQTVERQLDHNNGYDEHLGH
jgi:hypothetical protein